MHDCPVKRCMLNIDWLLAPASSAMAAPVADERQLARFCELIRGANTLLLTRIVPEELQQRLTHIGLDAADFAGICAAWDPGAAQSCAELQRWIERHASSTDATELFLLSDQRSDLQWATQQTLSPCLVPIAVASQQGQWEDHAWFVARDLGEATALLAATPRPETLSVVLMAYNEAESIQQAIVDIRRFGQLFWGGHEIIVVDDGSIDGSGALARDVDEGDVHVLRHATNMGMGASMRDGYVASRSDYITALPADRQVRAQSLIPFLERLSPDCCVHGYYTVPHSGARRQVMSTAFRLMLRHVGGLTVDFAGGYMFHSSWRDRVDPLTLPSNSFLFSFELLQALASAGCQMHAVEVKPFARETGASRVARPGRILKIFGEVMLSRLQRT